MFVAGRRHRLGIGLLAAGVVALSACSGSASTPRTLPALSTTPAADASTAPPTSRAAELAAVKAVVRRYYALLNAPTTIANADALAALMTRDCPCHQVADAIRDMARANRHYFGHSTLVSLRPYIDTKTEADVYVQYNYSTSGYADSNGQVLHSEHGRTGAKVDFRLSPRNGTWLISRVDLISAGTT